jgi:hypothetical protein
MSNVAKMNDVLNVRCMPNTREFWSYEMSSPCSRRTSQRRPQRFARTERGPTCACPEPGSLRRETLPRLYWCPSVAPSLPQVFACV